MECAMGNRAMMITSRVSILWCIILFPWFGFDIIMKQSYLWFYLYFVLLPLHQNNSQNNPQQIEPIKEERECSPSYAIYSISTITSQPLLYGNKITRIRQSHRLIPHLHLPRHLRRPTQRLHPTHTPPRTLHLRLTRQLLQTLPAQIRTHRCRSPQPSRQPQAEEVQSSSLLRAVRKR